MINNSSVPNVGGRCGVHQIVGPMIGCELCRRSPDFFYMPYVADDWKKWGVRKVFWREEKKNVCVKSPEQHRKGPGFC